MSELTPHMAREMLLTGRRMGAEEAGRWGLVSRVVPGDELLAAALALAASIATSAPLSVAALLDIERRTINLSSDEAMATLKSLDSYRRAIDSEDALAFSVLSGVRAVSRAIAVSMSASGARL